jgi:hypothetical protein
LENSDDEGSFGQESTEHQRFASGFPHRTQNPQKNGKITLAKSKILGRISPLKAVKWEAMEGDRASVFSDSNENSYATENQSMLPDTIADALVRVTHCPIATSHRAAVIGQSVNREDSSLTN